MRILTTSIFRALCALLVGFLLVSNPKAMSPLLVQIIGGLFAVSGVISLITYYVNRFRYRRALRRAAEAGVEVVAVEPFSGVTPFVTLGSVAFGALLIVFPDTFVEMLMYVLGALLVLLGVAQGVGLVRGRSIAPLGWSLLLMPLLLIAAGVFVIMRPQSAAAVPFVILGVAFILYGITEFCFGLRFHHFNRIYERSLADAMQETTFVEAEEITDDEVSETQSHRDKEKY